jgi:hypothetical protein
VDTAPRPAFCVAVVGAADLMPAAALARLLDLLAGRYLGTHRVCLVSAGRRSPELRWCQDRGWTLLLEPQLSSPVRQECALAAAADALVVLGDPAPWRRLIDLCRQAGTPTRVYRRRPRLPRRAADPHPAEG